MPELRMLSVSFDTHLLPWQLPQFRGAMAEQYTFRESLLAAYILVFATGVGWQLPVAHTAQDHRAAGAGRLKDLKVLAFTLDFEVGVGVGRGRVWGMGWLEGNKIAVANKKHLDHAKFRL